MIYFLYEYLHDKKESFTYNSFNSIFGNLIYFNIIDGFKNYGINYFFIAENIGKQVNLLNKYNGLIINGNNDYYEIILVFPNKNLKLIKLHKNNLNLIKMEDEKIKDYEKIFS